MPNKHWGEIEEEESTPFEFIKFVPTCAKKPRLDAMQQCDDPLQEVKQELKLELQSSLVTQTIEVKQQTEVLRTLIDVYDDTPNLMMPEVQFPPKNTADLWSGNKRENPIGCLPIADTAFTRGDAQSYPMLTNNICRQAIRKAICGLLRAGGYAECTEAAVVTLTDVAASFYQNLISTYRGYADIEKLGLQSSLRLMPLERAYMFKTGKSLAQLHNFYHHKVISRNRAAKADFESMLQEYDKLQKSEERNQPNEQEVYQEQEGVQRLPQDVFNVFVQWDDVGNPTENVDDQMKE